MPDNRFIIREPLLDSRQQVLGFRLNWEDEGAPGVSAGLPEAIFRTLHDADGSWLLGNRIILLRATPTLIAEAAFDRLSARHVVVRMSGAELLNPESREPARRLKAAGFGISLRDGHAVVSDKELLREISHIEVRFSTSDIGNQARLYASLKPFGTRMVAKNVHTWEHYDACAALGLDALVGKLHLTPRPQEAPKGLSAAQTAIVELMQMVQSNSDIRNLENVLKREPSISYKLLRYINSAGFGQRSEITSLRHAVSLLGYGPLLRWLSLLLATAGSYSYTPVLLQTAVLRGRFAELLGAKYLSSGGGENLFVAGMFSVLDRLTGLPMETLLDKVPLAEEIKQALLGRQGALGPYLALVEACELGGNLAGSLAANLKVTAEDVNEAHLSALVWTDNVLA